MPTSDYTTITLKPGRVFAFAWLLQRRTDAPDCVTIDSKLVLSIIHGPTGFADALRRSRASIGDEWPEYELINYTCFELLQSQQ